MSPYDVERIADRHRRVEWSRRREDRRLQQGLAGPGGALEQKPEDEVMAMVRRSGGRRIGPESVREAA